MRSIVLWLYGWAFASHGRRMQPLQGGMHAGRERSQMHSVTSSSNSQAEVRLSKSDWEVGASNPLSVLAALLMSFNSAWDAVGAGYGHGLALNGFKGVASQPAIFTSRPASLRAAVRLADLPSELQPNDNDKFAEALIMLHSPAVAAEAQQGRLRKVFTPDTVAASTKCMGSLLDPGTASPVQNLALPEGAGSKDSGTKTVHLVGVGPGDIELLTIKALRLIQGADLVLYDRLISPEILELAGPQAAMLYVGKEAAYTGDGAVRRQHQINELLLHFASSGKTVVRLKGGDPTVFGRGGEEMEYLDKNGVHVNIVPGITAAAGIAAGLGVPLTHRDHANSVRYITGHARAECNATVKERYPWEQLADPNTTLVVYMGLKTLPELTAGLLAAGLSANTPAVAVQDGTTPTQRVVAGPLHELSQKVKEAKLRSPTLVLIGGVVSMLDEDVAAPNATTGVTPEESKLAKALQMLALNASAAKI